MVHDRIKNFVTVFVVALAIFGSGLAIGYVIGDQHIFNPAKDQNLLTRGELSEVYYSSGKFAEENGNLCKAEERYRLALSKNPYHEDAHKALQRLSTPKNCNK